MVAALSLMFLDYHRVSWVSTLRAQLNGVVSVLQYTVDTVGKLARVAVTGWSRQSDLMNENSQLKEELLLLEAKVQRLLALEAENNQLHALLSASAKLDNHQMMIADVLSVDTTLFKQEIIVSVGSKQGVYVGQPVLDAKGVIGHVVEVSGSTSRVLLLTDRESAIPVTVIRSGLRAIAVGHGTDLQLVRVAANADLQIGDELVTSGLGGRYPAGYPVGTIVLIEQESGDFFATVRLASAANVVSPHTVLLVFTDSEHGQ